MFSNFGDETCACIVKKMICKKIKIWFYVMFLCHIFHFYICKLGTNVIISNKKELSIRVLFLCNGSQ